MFNQLCVVSSLPGTDLLFMWKMEIPGGTDLAWPFQCGSWGALCTHSLHLMTCAHTCAHWFLLLYRPCKQWVVELRWLKTCSASSSFLPGSTLEYSSLCVAAQSWIFDLYPLLISPVHFLAFVLVLSTDDCAVHKNTEDHWGRRKLK